MKNSKMKKLVLRRNEKLHRSVILFFTAYAAIYVMCNMVSFILVAAGEDRIIDTDAMDNVFLFINTLTYQNFFIGFVAIIYEIYLFLDVIDSFLDQILKADDASGNGILEMLWLVKILLDKICHALQKVTRCYVINTFAFIIYFSFFNIFCLYGIVSFFLPGATSTDFVFWMLALLWTVYNSWFFAGTFIIASWIERKGQTIEAKCYKILYKFQISDDVSKSVQNLSMQLNHQTPIFSCALFVVDWKYFFYNIGLCFTYIVIILQFEFQL